MKLNGKIAVITGGGSGMGRDFLLFRAVICSEIVE
jgi:short-subunit dehydrogenase involved in D-alanine esterification of teichoic acids